MSEHVRIACLAAAALTVACALDHEPKDKGSTGSVEQKAVWGSADTPSNVDATYLHALAQLPQQGESTVKPWIGTTWLIQQDSINLRWDGANSQSAASKYQSAFGSTDVEDNVSLGHGIDAWSARPSCTDSSQCNTNAGEVCGKRTGQTQGRCVMSAWSMSAAWAAASILFPEPRNPVTVNGVTFKVQDIKALATVINDPPEMQVLGSACTLPITLDQYGRPTDAACRDTNAGAFHVMVTNRIGLQQQPLVTVRLVDGVAQHHPAFRYAVLEQRAVSLGEAWQKMGPGSSGTATPASGSLAQGAWFQQAPITVTPGMGYRVAMTGTGDADLYVHFGSQPSASTYTCRPYLGSSTEVCEGVVPAGASQLYVGVHGYTAATFALDTTTHPSTWSFQPTASSLQYVKMRLSYLAPSAPSLDGNLATALPNYTREDEFEYVLESDSNGNIVGGEWLGADRTEHPDFLWNPMALTESKTVAFGRITFATVRPLVEVSSVLTVTHSGSLALNEWKTFGPYAVRPGTTLEATTTGTGDIDLYVATSGTASDTNYACRSWTSTANETCTVPGTTATSVALHGFTAGTYTLTIKYTPL